MKKRYKNRLIIDKYVPELGGVFRISDLKTILNETHPTSLYRTIDQLVEENQLQRFVRGIYISESPNLEILSQRIAPESYISFTRILSENHIVGVSPDFLVEGAKVGKNKTYKNGNIEIRHYGISKELFFGYKSENGILKATAEKAWLDVMYHHLHGTIFPFNVYEDLDKSKLDEAVICRFLKKYRNPKFVNFIKGQLG